MKILITDYSFNKTSKTITFNSMNEIELKRILLITNSTKNVIIYNFADPAKGGTITDNILTLTYNTSAMSDSDELQIYYDLENFAIAIDDTTTANVTYVGKAAIGATASDAFWQIKKIDETTGLIITWANGNDNFDNVWNNRATTISYS